MHPIKTFVAIVLTAISAVCCKAANGAYKSTDKIFGDTATSRKLIFHHHFDIGVICRLGKEDVRTYDDYDHATTKTSNYIVGKYDKLLMVRMAHGIVFKKNFEAGITYGTDIYVQPHNVRAFLPLMLHILNNTRLSQKIALLFIERAGYSFYFRHKNYDPYMKYEGVEGGFTSETLAGFSIRAKHKNYVQLLLGYRFQHLYSKSVFYPDQTLRQPGGSFANLPDKITEISNGFYHFIYVSLGVPF